MTYTITRENAAHDLKALQLAISIADDAHAGITSASLQDLADSIEEQVKPAIEEPTEFGSVVRAGASEFSDRLLWLRGGGHYWFSETLRRADFCDLHQPEVLRVGIGEPEPLAQWETDLLNQQERRDVASAVLAAMDVDQYLATAVRNAWIQANRPDRR